MPKTLTLPKKSGETHDTGDRDDDNAGSIIGTANKDREDLLNAIADGNDSTRTEDLADINDDGTTSLQADAPVEEEAPVVPTDDTQVTETPKKFKLKVNGQEVEKTESEVLELAQKVASADDYLRTASESVKTAATLALSEKDEPKVDRKALVRAIQMGTEEEAEQALEQLFEALQPPKTPDVAEVVETRLTLRERKAKFDEDYKDVLTDPMLAKLVQEKDKELYEADKSLPYDQRWSKAAESVRTWAKSQGLKAVSPSDKAARKALTTPVPTAAGRQTPVADEEESDAPQDVIAKMAKQRGQELR